MHSIANEQDSNRKHIVPSTGTEMAISKSGLVRRGLAELESILGTRVRVLLVDDLDEVRINLRKLFDSDESEPGIEVVAEAETGVEGIEQFELHKPDLVITNVHMPIMDGIAMARKITDDHPDAKILFLSVESRPAIIRRAVRAGALGYMCKPPSSEELLSTIYEAASQPKRHSRFYFDSNGWRTLYELGGDFIDHEGIRRLKGWSTPPIGRLIGIGSRRSVDATFIKDLNFAEIRSLEMSASAISDRAGPVVGRAINLESLYVDHTKVGDGFLSGLYNCRRLKTLGLSDTSVGFSPNPVFSSLGALKDLYLSHTNVGDEFLLSLSANRQLQSLDISNTAVRIAGLSVLPYLMNLTSLSMNNMEKSLGDLRYLAQLPNLRSLYLKGARFDNGSLRNLVQLPNLQNLSLGDIPLNELDVDIISSMKGLKRIYLHGTGLGADASEELKRSLPSCEVRM